MGVLDDAWTTVLRDIDAGWGGTLTKGEQGSYRRMLERSGFKPNVVAEAVLRLAQSGREFYPRPSVAQLIAECRLVTGQTAPGELDAPTWDEIAWDAEHCAYTYRRAEAANKVTALHGPVAGSWIANGGGYDLLRQPIEAAEKHDRARRSFTAFVAAEQRRERHGLPVSFDRPGARLRVVEPIRALEAGE